MPNVLNEVAHSGVIVEVGVENFLRNSYFRISSERGSQRFWQLKALGGLQLGFCDPSLDHLVKSLEVGRSTDFRLAFLTASM